jgi:hypothetical protein
VGYCLSPLRGFRGVDEAGAELSQVMEAWNRLALLWRVRCLHFGRGFRHDAELRRWVSKAAVRSSRDKLFCSPFWPGFGFIFRMFVKNTTHVIHRRPLTANGSQFIVPHFPLLHPRAAGDFGGGSSFVRHGQNSVSDGFNLFHHGQKSVSDGSNLFRHGQMSVSHGPNLFRRGQNSVSHGPNLFHHGQNSVSDGPNLFRHGPNSVSHGPNPVSGSKACLPG